MTLPFVLRNLARRRSRTVLSILGVLVTLALVTSIQVALDSVSVSFLDLVSLQAGRADVVITSKDASLLNPQPFDPEPVLKSLAQDPELRGLSPRLFGLVQLQAKGASYDAILIGVDIEKERALDVSGVSPLPARGKGYCSISKSLAEKLKVKDGAELSVRPADGFSEVTLRLDRVIERQQILPQHVRDYAVADMANAREICGLSQEVHALAGALSRQQAFYNPRDLHGSVMRLKQAGAAWAAQLGMDHDVKLPKAAALTAFQDFTSPLRAVLGVFALLALAITGLLIYSVLSVAVEERIREYAILRTLGTRRRQVWGVVLTESLIMCLAGVVPGVVVGMLGAKVLVTLVGLGMGADAGAIQLELRWTGFASTIAAGTLLALGSAVFPALHATRWSIVDALDPLRRGQIRDKPVTEGQDRSIASTGLALTALSGVIFFILPSALFSGDPSLIGTVFLCLLLLMLFGLTLASLGVLPPLQKGVLFVIGGAFQPSTELVGRNLQRHRRRHATTTLLFCLSVSLVVFVASLVALASRTAMALVEHSNGADLVVHAPQLAYDNLKPTLTAVQGVQHVAEARFLHSRSEYGVAYDVVVGDLVGMKHLWVVPFGVDADLGDALYLGEGEERGAGSPMGQLCANTRLAVGTGTTNTLPGVVLSLAAADYLNVRAGDVVQISFRLGSERRDDRFRVTAVWRTLPGFQNFRGRVAHAVGSGVLMPLAEFTRLTRAAPADAFQAIYFIRAKEGNESHKETARRIRSELDIRHRFGVKCTEEQKQEARAIYWVTQILFGFLLAAAVTIAVFALIASMAATVMERTREIGVLKALGMRRGGLLRLFLGEAVTLTLSAGLAGGAIGFFLAWMFVFQAAVLMEIPVTFTMPYLTLVATLLISVVAGGIAAWLPTRSLLRRTAAEILRG